jgi:hypothetical protein
MISYDINDSISRISLGTAAKGSRAVFAMPVAHVEDVAERLDVIPAKFRVIITRRPKYTFKGWDGVIQTLAPCHTPHVRELESCRHLSFKKINRSGADASE